MPNGDELTLADVLAGLAGNQTGNAAGVVLFDSQGNPIGKLTKGNPGLPGFNSQGFGLEISPGVVQPFKPGTYLIDAGLGKVWNVIIDVGGNITKSAISNLPSGGGGAAPSFASTQAAQTQAEAFAKAQAEAQRAFETEQNRLGIEARAEAARVAEEGALQRGRLSTLTDLVRGFLAEQGRAQTTLANLQPDAFRFAAVKGGIAPFGVTPQESFQKELTSFAQAPAPTIDPNASAASLQTAITQLTGAQAPQPAEIFGMAEGGSVKPSTQPQSFLVGERGPEVMTVTAQGVQVTPLVGGFQAGGAVGFPFTPVPFDKETLFPALGTSGIFGAAGFDFFPQRRRADLPSGNLGIQASSLGGARGLSQLGFGPRIIRQPGEGLFYAEDDQLRPLDLETFNRLGFRPRDVVAFDQPESFDLFRGGRTIGAPLTQRPPIPVDQPSAFTKFSAPLVEPTTGTVLPAPFMVAEQLNQLRVTQPNTFNLLLSAYESAGVPGLDVLGTIQQSLTFGRERGAVGLR